MKSKTDGDLSLDSYWKKHCISIAKDRHWAIQEGDQYSFETCTTLRQYDDYIKKVAGYLDMSISEIKIFCSLSLKSLRNANTKKRPLRRSSQRCGTSFPMPPHADMLTTSSQKIVRETSQIILRL